MICCWDAADRAERPERPRRRRNGPLRAGARLHEADAVDALFAAKDVLWLFRGNDILPEEEDKKASSFSSKVK